jgi:hypothetical protein
MTGITQGLNLYGGLVSQELNPRLVPLNLPTVLLEAGVMRVHTEDAGVVLNTVQSASVVTTHTEDVGITRVSEHDAGVVLVSTEDAEA